MTSSSLSILSALPGSASLVDVRSGAHYDAATVLELAGHKANSLVAAGMRHGDRVVVADRNVVDFVISIFACWVAGLTAVAVNPAISADEQANVLSATQARHFCGELRAHLAPASATPTEMPHCLKLDEPALILMTSGTTGRPKGIVHSLRGLLARIALNIAEIGHGPLAETLCVLPAYFGHGLIGNILTPLFAGGRVHLWPTPDIAELRSLASEIGNRRIGFMSSVPSFWKIALRVASRPKNPLNRIHVGSAPLSLALWSEIAEWGSTRNVFNMFGMTETANWIGGGSLEENGACDGFVGRAWGGRMAVLDEAGNIRFSGDGEIVVQTPAIMLGYWQRPELDEAAFAGHWFRTGDTGSMDGAGKAILRGRKKTEINRGGIKVQAEEVDMLLERHDGIAEACAFAIPHPIAGETVAAAVVMKSGCQFDPEAIKLWCARHARADAVPDQLHVLSALPRNDRGKIVRGDVLAAVENLAK